MEQIWIRYQELHSKEYRTKKFWYTEEAKEFADYLKRNSEFFRIVACGGFEDEDEKQYVIGE